MTTTPQGDARGASESVVQAERELLAVAGARYGPLFEQLPFVAYIDRLDELSSNVFTSRQIEDLSGYSAHEWRDDPELFVKALHPDDRERVMSEHERTCRTGEPLSIEYRLLKQDGSIVWFRDEAVVVTDTSGTRFLHGYMLDVTARRTAEEERALRARQHEALAELGVLALSQRDLDLLFREALAIAAETLCIDTGSVLELDEGGESLLVRAGFGAAEGFVGSTTGVDSQAGYTLERQAPVIAADLTRETRFAVSPLLRAFGARSGVSCVIHGDMRPFGVIGVHASTVRSYTDDDANFLQVIANVLASAVRRARVEVEVREASERFSRAFGDAPLAIALLSFDRRYLQVNAAFCELVGYTAEELAAKTFLELTHPDDRTDLDELWEGLLAGELRLYHLEKRCLHRDGHVVPTLVSCSPVRDGDGKPLYFVAHVEDLTERRRAEAESTRLEEQLRQAQKLEAIGRLAGGIAHDFNNLLLAITGYTELALTELGRPDELRKDLDEIRRAAERAASLTRQLLAFSRRQVLEPEVLDLHEIVAEMESMLRRLIGEDVELVTQLDAGSPSVLADRGQLEQVIVNLALNGRDAMPDGGALTIATRTVELGEGWGAEQDLPGGTYVVLSVSDTGIGMDTETQQRAFDPFFTTKGPGKGTRARARDGARDRAPERRRHPGDERRRARYDDRRVPAVRRPARRADRSAGAARAAARLGDDPPRRGQRARPAARGRHARAPGLRGSRGAFRAGGDRALRRAPRRDLAAADRPRHAEAERPAARPPTARGPRRPRRPLHVRLQRGRRHRRAAGRLVPREAVLGDGARAERARGARRLIRGARASLRGRTDVCPVSAAYNRRPSSGELELPNKAF